MARKYLRGLQYTTGANGRDIPIFMRITYEFWGYCLNGTSSLTTPGGMPTTPTSAPAGFFEGSSVLATGNDGVTSDLGINFTSASANFDISMINKHITIWSHTDTTSTDNSIYRIVNVLSPTQLMLDPVSGGTRDNTTLKNVVSSRSALNYRVIDVVAASQLISAAGSYWVGTLSGASSVNTGQASSQFQFILRGVVATFGNFGVVVNPAGSWNGSAFTTTSIAEKVSASNNSMSGTGAGVNGFITIIADTDFIIAHIRSPNGVTSGMYFNVIVPQRLYTQAQDPNPVCVLVGASNLTTGTGVDSYSNSFSMLGANGSTTVNCQLLTRNFAGDAATTASMPYTIGPNLTGALTTQPRLGKVVYSDALISCITTNQFALARAKLNRVAFTSSVFPNYHLLGDNGEFIHVGNGILWPWDGCVMTAALLPLGQ